MQEIPSLPEMALVPWSNQPTQTAAAGADTVLKFGAGGTTEFNHCSIQNNTAANIFYAFDQSTTVAGNQVYTLAPGQAVFWDRLSFALHVSSAAQQNIGGQTGITVEVFA